ncbi:hypothetical protein JDV02_006880 [Purpureocillium takamizusanense]|nr:uncharacterized protein JDV02_006880 [Purpureocillium takamizusanense]UNI20829.1 hypothetical protein JDV02_006880 [Purpureocillium takamizusanense]
MSAPEQSEASNSTAPTSVYISSVGPTAKADPDDVRAPPQNATESGPASEAQRQQASDHSPSESAQQVVKKDKRESHAERLNDQEAQAFWKRPYIHSFAKEIAIAISSQNLSAKERDSLAAALPRLLKSFARAVGHEDPSRLHQGLAKTVLRWRESIAGAVINMLSTREEEKDEEEEGKRLRPIERDTMAFGHHSVPAPKQDQASPGSGTGSADDLEDYSENPQTFHTLLTRSRVGSMDSGGYGLSDKELGDHELDDYTEFQKHRAIFSKSPAFQVLLTSIVQQVKFETVGRWNATADVRRMISTALREAGPRLRRHSLRSLTLSIPRPRQFFEDQDYDFDGPLARQRYGCREDDLSSWESFEDRDYDVPPREILDRVLVLIGVGRQAWATTCLDYVQSIWPSIGQPLLEIYLLLLRRDEIFTRIVSSNTFLTAKAEDRGRSALVTVTGSSASILEIGEALAWLSVAFSPGSLDDVVVSSYPQGFVDGDVVRFEANYELGQPTTGIEKGGCWVDLFSNPVLASGYPIPKRPDALANAGIEMSLHMMGQLLNTNKTSIFKGMILLKGVSSMLVPAGRHEGFILWHLISNHNGSYLSYSDPRVERIRKDYLKELSMGELELSRHIVGWCAEAINHTGCADANYNIRWSGLDQPRAGCAFEKVTITAGHYITSGVSCVLGKKDKPVHAWKRDDYVVRLKWISKKFVVLYDVRDRRAWLVDGASALLHLVRASLKHDQNDAFSSLCLFDASSFKESGRPGTGKSASIEILTNKHNIGLPLYENPDSSKKKISVDEAGNQSSVLSVTQANYTLRQRIDSICHTLEQIVAHQADVSSEDGVGFRVKTTLRRQLEGFNFMDVATDEDPIWPRVTTLRVTGRGWVDFARSIHAVTLFGSRFGELIRPATRGRNACGNCLFNAEVPKGRDYLAVCVPEVEEILEKCGSQGTIPWRLVDDIYWHAPGKTFEPCTCSGSPPAIARTDRVQVLLPSLLPNFWTRGLRSPAADPSLTPRGAYLFGHSQRFPLRWKDQGLPEEGEPDQTPADDAPQDSGLGSSLSMSSGSNNEEGRATASSTSQAGSHAPSGSLEHEAGVASGGTASKPRRPPALGRFATTISKLR